MPKRQLTLLLLSIGLTFTAGAAPAPNVVLILADDLGWQDVGCYDIDRPSPMETPNIDALARRGILFRQGYSPAPTCAPTRCAILSGNHPARARKTHVVGGAPPHPHSKSKWRMMEPWYSGRMPEDEVTLAKVLAANGYATGHAGKWHMAIDHHAFPQPVDQGFQWTRSNLGVSKKMTPHRRTGFATDQPDDPFRLDEDGFPRDQNTEDAIEFIAGHKDQPFFLYVATWLVHTPIQTRSREHLDKYVEKLGVQLPENPEGWAGEGQTNPYYCAMVEEFDHYVGRLVAYLEKTDDPRNPGHKLIDNTYVILTSDNGGMEAMPGEVITDNYPLDRGKISLMEGGTRVPFIVTGPGVKAGVDSDVMVNGLDFYPTILSLTGVEKPAGKHLDGADLEPLWHGDPTDPALVKTPDGKTRDTMVWHFPHSVALESTIRTGDYKLVRNYDHVNNRHTPELELYRLYRTEDGRQVREDIEEAKNLAAEKPDLAREMNDRLTAILTEMGANYPSYNPQFGGKLPHQETVPSVTGHRREGGQAVFSYEDRGAKVVRADLIYTLNGGQKHEEWFCEPAEVRPGGEVAATLPAGTTHYFINLIDEHNFLVSHPDPLGEADAPAKKAGFADHAIAARK
ncbi:MAG: sulfatase [Chthoniobacterales bacterium]